MLMWKRGEKKFIAVGEQVIDDSSRAKLENSSDGQIGNYLVITTAEPEDGGDYTCQVSSAKRMAITHRVKVRGKPAAEINRIACLKMHRKCLSLLSRLGREGFEAFNSAFITRLL